MTGGGGRFAANGYGGGFKGLALIICHPDCPYSCLRDTKRFLPLLEAGPEPWGATEGMVTPPKADIQAVGVSYDRDPSLKKKYLAAH